MPECFETIKWSGVVYKEWSKGPTILPCEMPNSNRKRCDFELETTTV